MRYILLTHVILGIWVLIDGHRRKENVIPWAIGAAILGLIILPPYINQRPSKAEEFLKTQKIQNLLKGLSLFWALMLAAIGIWGGKTYTTITRNEPLEYRLAVINSRSHLCGGNEDVARFRSLLDQLSENYVEDHRQIANITVMVHDKMSVGGLNKSLLSIMEGLSQLQWPEGAKKRSYSEYAFAYAGLRNTGLPHKEAIEQLQAIISGY